jgi:hypothetical protein
MEGVHSVLAKGGFRFKVVFGSDLEKHFGSDLMTDTRGVFKGSLGSVKGFECGHSLHGGRCAGKTAHRDLKGRNRRVRQQRSRLRLRHVAFLRR